MLLQVMSVLVVSTVMAFFLVQAIITAGSLPQQPRPRPSKPLTSVPAFRLFPPNAAISLTDDNSTFFPARPAAFGPELTDDGLSAILWIGAGFGEDGIEPQGELGCSDVPGWDGRRAAVADGVPVLPTDKNLDDGTDNYLEDFATTAYYRNLRKGSLSKAVPVTAAAAAAGPDSPALAATAGTDDAADTASVAGTAIAADTGNSEAEKGSAGIVTGEGKQVATEKATAEDKVSSAGDAVIQHGSDAFSGNGGSKINEASHHGDIQSLQEGAEIAGKIVLLRRGGCGFLAKVMWAQRRGAVAVIVGDDRKGGPLVQMYAAGDTSEVHIPSVFTAHTTAHLLTALAAAAVRDDAVMAKKKAAALAAKTKPAATIPPAASKAKSAGSGKWFRKSRPREWVLAEWAPAPVPVPPVTEASTFTDDGGDKEHARALWVTIAPARGSLPLIDTLLVLVASPFLAIVTITAVLLFFRTQFRYRAWRAPKELVAQLPVHIFNPPESSSSVASAVTAGLSAVSPSGASPISSSPSSPELASMEPTVTTPLLQRPRSRTTTGVPGDERRATIALPPPPPHNPPSRYHQAECVVCLEEYVAGDRVMSLPCGHEFHASCITPWLTTRRRTCPICKGDIVRAVAGGEAA